LGSRFRVQGSGFRIEALEVGVQGVGFEVCEVWGLWFIGLRVLRDLGLGFRDQGGFRIHRRVRRSIAVERRGNILHDFKNFYLQAKARIWP